MPIISAKKLIKKYPNPEVPGETFFAVKDVNLNIEEGEIFGLLGPNGAGKTTTLEMLEGLNNFDEGSIEIDGIDVKVNPYELKKIIGVQLQSNEYFDSLNLSDLLNLFAALYSTSIKPEEILSNVQLKNKISALPDELSGGQRQIVFLLRCVLRDNKIIILDEPTSALDNENRKFIMNILEEMFKDKTLIIITHDNEILEHVDRIVYLKYGKLVGDTKTKK